VLQPDRGAKLEQQLASAEEALQAEHVAHSKLQADVAAERSQAALVKVGSKGLSCCRSRAWARELCMLSRRFDLTSVWFHQP
jgi:hypothetical protein